MDEYLRNRYKKADKAGAAKPMFPVDPKPVAQAIQPGLIPEARSAPAEHHQPAAKQPWRLKPRFGLVKILAALLILIAAGAGGGFYYQKYIKAPTPLPKQVVKSATFPVYYPSKLPGTYQYQAGSAGNQSNLVTYKVADGSNGVTVTQQPLPPNFNTAQLPNFKTIDVSGGTAVIGVSSNATTIVYTTPTTLINMTAINGISQADMISIAQTLAAVKK